MIIQKCLNLKIHGGKNWGVNGYGYLPYEYYLSGNMFDLWSIYTEMVNMVNTNLKIINPLIDKMIVKNQYIDILQSISENLNLIEYDTKKINDYFTFISNKYKDNSKLLQMITNLRNNYISIVLN
jgi:hypothetical protein